MSSIMEDDGDDKDDSKRRTRNLSEKKRRDQFNTLVNELSALIASTSRKMDKSTVLKSTISYLKNHNEIKAKSRAHDVQQEWKPSFLSNEEFKYLLLEALEGFIMVFSASGQIFYVSESITSLLGHDPADVLKQNIFDLTYEKDRQNLYNMLQNPAVGDYMQASSSTSNDNQIRFQFHLRRRQLDYRDEASYELIQFNGHFRNNADPIDGDEIPGYQQDHDAGLIFVCTGRLHTPQLIRDVSLIDPSCNEFTSRHSLEWKFLFLDHRAPPIIGYLPFEVLGTSGYDYYHFDDLEKIIRCHEALMHKGELTSCHYRFLTKGQQWIWLQSRFYITYHQWNSKPEFVVCTHSVISYSDIVRNSKSDVMESVPSIEMEPGSAVAMNTPSDDGMVNMSPSYMSEASEAFAHSYHNISHPPSVKSASAGSTTGTIGTSATAGASWSRASRGRYYTESDTGSLSGESRTSRRHSSRDLPHMSRSGHRYHPHRCHGAIMMVPQHRGGPAQLLPQHNIGAQYLDPAPYVGALSGVLQLPLPSLPVIVSPDQAQMQLQKKHEELQEMIVRQQEELRQVKEQLLLARLGMLQPIINVPNAYISTDDLAAIQRVPAQLTYDESNPSPNHSGYSPSHPPNSHDHHQNMPQ